MWGERAGAEGVREAVGPRVRAQQVPISVVVPVRNERAEVPRLARRLERLAARAEVFVVDGESEDGTLAALAPLCPSVTLLRSRRGRARQMNEGARRATRDVLLFLHADTLLDEEALDRVARSIEAGAGFGCFRVRIASRDWRLRLAARLISLRSRLLCSATGDQAIFVERRLFETVGGFPDVALCEDLELVHRLCGRARFACLDRAVETSARRWERSGVGRTIALMWGLRAAWHLGVPPAWLARLYADVR